MSRIDIRNRMLADIDPSFDTSEKTFYYENLDAVAIELNPKYEEVEEVKLQRFMNEITNIEDAKGRADEVGVDFKYATYATTIVEITGGPGATINIGDLVANDSVEYAAVESVTIPASGKVDVNVKCTVSGSQGNCIIGAIKYFPVTLANITLVTNKAAVTNGFDDESLESIKARFYSKVREIVTSGNEGYYKNLAEAVSGVGVARVFSLESGNGTATISIVNANGLPADQSLIDSVKAEIDLNRIIGLNPTVDTATELAVNLTGTVILASGTTLQNFKDDITAKINAKFKADAYNVDNVVYSDLFLIVRESPGVDDLQNFQINGANANISLTAKQVAKLGTVGIVD